MAYGSENRPHIALDHDAPVPRPVERPTGGRGIAMPRIDGLHQHFMRRAA